MKRYIMLKEKTEQIALREWWRQMNPGPDWQGPSYAGRRAELRRATAPADVFTTEGFSVLAAQIGDRLTKSDHLLLALAAAAGIVAHIKEDESDQSFAAQLGRSKREDSDTPVFSPLRFARLQQAHDFDLFYRRMIRAVRSLGGKANVLSIADGVLQWAQEELNKVYQGNPRDRLRVRWGLDYFRKPSTKKLETEEELEELS